MDRASTIPDETPSERTHRKNNKLAGPVASNSGVAFGRKIEDKDFCCGFACVKFGTTGSQSSDDDERDQASSTASQQFFAQEAAADDARQEATANSLVARLLEAPELANLSQERRSDLQATLAPLLAKEMSQSQPEEITSI